jgi:alpha-glucosidase (family GH31 glycosyl hydrolase)
LNRFDTKNLENGFIFSDQFIQIVMNINYGNIYGFGENSHHSYRHQFHYSNWWGVFGRDQPPGDKRVNLYGAQPFFMAVSEETGRAFGVLILNSNAQEYGFLPPQAVSFRTIGGILDLYIMEEETPEKLIQTYTQLIGKPYMPP